MEEAKNIKVCVTGGAGYLGTSLVKKLLERGYTVHATMRNIGDPKAGVLKGLPKAESGRLELFEADIYNPQQFDKAIQGCQYVVHMATPMGHNPQSSKYKSMSEAAVGGVEEIIRSCIRSGTVKRIVYTASVVAASPLEDDGTKFKDVIDESCWTPLHLPYSFTNDYLTGYVHSKTLSEKEMLSSKYNGKVEVVSLGCGLVGGNTLLSTVSDSASIIISAIMGNKGTYTVLRFLEELLGKVPLVHVEDVANAHIFCMENPSAVGRFLCASTYLSSAEIATCCRHYFPEILIAQEFIEDMKREICWGSRKLEEIGFKYEYDMKMILDDTLKCAQRLGHSIGPNAT